MSTPSQTLPELGGIVAAGDPGYDEARHAWNLVADLRPDAAITATSVADVITATRYAAARGLRIAPLTTGHLGPALGDLTGALLLRTAIGGVEIDPQRRVARVGAGAIWQDVATAAEPHGLAALSGSAHDVGVVGYTLGGGLSWLARKHGLSCNNVEAIELVTPDGEFVRCDSGRHPELFWALRGGGGNFGVVTHIEINLFPVSEVFAGMTVWPAAQAREVLAAWTHWTETAPDDVTTSLRLLRLPPDPSIPEPLRDTPILVIDGAALGENAEALTAGFRGVSTPVLDMWAPMPPSGLLQIHMDPPEPMPALSDSSLLGDLDHAGRSALLDVVDELEISPLMMVELRQLGGALARTPEGAGAAHGLDAKFVLFGGAAPMGGPPHAAAIEARLTDLIATMAPWSTGQRYLNFDERIGEAADCYSGDTYTRLRAIRAQWDPAGRMLASHEIG